MLSVSTRTTFHMRYKGEEEDIKADGANDKQAGSSGGEQSLQRRGNAGEKAVQELSDCPGWVGYIFQTETA